MDIFWKIRRKH